MVSASTREVGCCSADSSQKVGKQCNGLRQPSKLSEVICLSWNYAQYISRHNIGGLQPPSMGKAQVLHMSKKVHTFHACYSRRISPLSSCSIPTVIVLFHACKCPKHKYRTPYCILPSSTTMALHNCQLRVMYSHSIYRLADIHITM